MLPALTSHCFIRRQQTRACRSFASNRRHLAQKLSQIKDDEGQLAQNPGTARPEPVRPYPPEQPMFKNILVPTDGSKLSQKAVREAIEVAKVVNAKVTALHVYPKFAGSPYGTFGPAEDILEEAHENQSRAQAEQLFAGI